MGIAALGSKKVIMYASGQRPLFLFTDIAWFPEHLK